ncbi:MAG: DUF3857 domain-containing protein [Planctomycetes bacterium]|nr:DUF3857 domain-containing protein [Planctomycetota bacterium]
MKKNIKFLMINSLVILILTGAGQLFLQAEGSPPTAQKLNESTQAAWAAAQQGDLPKAIEHYEKAFRQILAEKPFENKNKLLSGLSEACLHQLMAWYDQSYNYAGLTKLLESTAGSVTDPNLQAWVAWYLGHNYLRQGKLKEARMKFQSLSFLTEWQIIGAFDNESRNGFKMAYPPEKKIDLDDEYDGKVRPVRWRAWSVPPIVDGYVNLDTLLQPNEKTVAYALSYVFVSTTTAVAFRMASDEGIKLWVNDEVVHSNDLKRRRCFFDQDVAPAVLFAGWNKVLVKSAETSGDWGFRLRVTDPAGAPLKEWKQTADKNQIANFTPVKKEDKTTSVKPIVNRGGLDDLESFVQENQLSSSAHFYLGCLYSARNHFDIQAKLNMKEFQKAVAVKPRSYFYYHLARSLQRETAMAAEREENQYRLALEKSLTLDGKCAVAALELAKYYYYSLHNVERSDDYLKTVFGINPDFRVAKYLELQLLGAKGFITEVSRRKKSLVTQYPDYPLFRLLLATELTGDSQVQKAVDIYQQWLEQVNYADNNVRFRLIDLYRRQGLVKRALEECNLVSELAPYNLRPYLKRAEIFEGLQNYPDALTECLKALTVAPENARLIAQKGDYFNWLGNQKAAREAWQEALRINPNNVWLKRYLEFIETDKVAFENPFKETLESILARIGDKKPSEESAVYYLLDQQVSKVNKEGTRSSYVHRVIKILNEKGVQDFNSIRVSYDPSRQSLKILTARVVHPDGSIEEARLGRGQFVGLPPLNINDIVDLEYKISDLRQDFFGDYFADTFYFGTNDPTARSIYTLIVPTNRKFYFNQKNFELKPTRTESPGDRTVIYTWALEDIKGFRPEPSMPPAGEIIPALQVSSYGDWKEFGRWYWQMIKRTFDFNDEMRLKLNELVPDKNVSEREKIKAIYDFVISEIRYEAWEYGIHGWKPYNASTVFTRKFGDCKDKALLLNVFLKEFGIKSEPVLIYAVEDRRGKEDLTLPMAEHFNHCISHVTLKDGSTLWLDGTASYFPVGTLPSGDMGATVFVVNESGGELKTIPYAPPEKNSKSEKTRIEIKPAGEATLTVSAVLKGDQASSYRYYFSNQAKAHLLIERLFGGNFGGAKVSRVTFSDLNDLSQPVTYEWVIDIPSFAQVREKEFHFRPFLSTLTLSRLCSRAEREFDLILKKPVATESRNEFILPAGAVVKSVPADFEIKNDFGSFSVSYQVKKNIVTVVHQFRLNTTRVSKEAYKEFREFAKQVDEHEDKEIVFELK